MLNHKLIHPEINRVLGQAGHGSHVLIADGNYPARTTLGPNASLVSLNLMPGLVNCVQVLRALASACAWESAYVMSAQGDAAISGDPPIWEQFQKLLQRQCGIRQLQRIERMKFYQAASTDQHVLTIQTGDQRLYANLLLTMGVRSPRRERAKME